MRHNDRSGEEFQRLRKRLTKIEKWHKIVSIPELVIMLYAEFSSFNGKPKIRYDKELADFKIVAFCQFLILKR
jgi:hypothetical protein